jgi:5-methylthioadenosine/S-adenosylhomocysteine deaminase
MLELATLGGAAALGLYDQIGSLEAGKQADLAVFSLDPVGPTQDPASAAIFALTAARTRFVSVAGTPLVRDGALVSSHAGLADRMRTLGESLAKWLDAGGEMQGVV